MKSVWETVKRFLTAEEVPRWFGLSIVLIYLLGLGAVIHFGVVQARHESAAYFQRSSEYAVKLLAKRLSALSERADDGQAEATLIGDYQRELRTFATNMPASSLRIVDRTGRIVASLNPAEIDTRIDQGVEGRLGKGRPLSPSFDHPESRARMPRQEASGTFLRVPLILRHNQSLQGASDPTRKRASASGRQAESSDAAGPRVGTTLHYLEVQLLPERYGESGLADQAQSLAVVLVVLGALFVVYRCLRGQMRSVSHIADQLRTHRDRLQEDLQSLHVADTLGGVTQTWNELIDLTQHLSQTVARSEADKELSQALQHSGSGALAEALDSIPDGIIYITDEVRFEYVNTTACRLFGWSTQEDRAAAGRTLPEAQAEGVGAKVLDLLRDALQSDGSYEERTEVLEADETDGCNRSSYRVRVISLPRARRPGECVVVIRDVSQQIRADRAREEFITQVTHELRTPLTNIRAYAETLSSGMFDDPAVITECYNVITKETRRLSRLIEDILSVSQLEVGTIELHHDQVDLKTLLSEGVRDVRGLADEKNIDLQLVLPAKLEPIRADRDKLAVVTNNLLGNAIKYTQSGGNIVVGCQCTDDEVAITFKDNGIGIDPADQARVFEKFQRCDDPAVQKESGTGIGLYTAREIVRHHHGDIDLISEKGQGSTFLVRLPRQATRATSLTTLEEG